MRVSPRFECNRVSRMRTAIARSPSTVRRSSRHPSSTPESLVDDGWVVDAKPGTCNNAPAPRPRAPGLDIFWLALAFRYLQPGRLRGRIGEDRAAQTARRRRHATPRRSASRCHPPGGLAMPNVPFPYSPDLPVPVGLEERLNRIGVSRPVPCFGPAKHASDPGNTPRSRSLPNAAPPGANCLPPSA